MHGIEGEREEPATDDVELDGSEPLRLGHDVRFVLAVVGGGASRVGQAVARRHVRYLETVAINCDSRVQDLEEFDRRVCLGWGGPGNETPRGSPLVAGHLAQAAEPALDRLFQGATFSTVVTCLGGGSGTGAFPFVLEAAARASEFVSAFVIKPFAAEGDRRSLADRAIARLSFLEAWVEHQHRRTASFRVLDNAALARREPQLALRKLNSYWGEVIATHIEQHYVIPTEAALEARRLASLAESERPAPPPAPPAHPGRFPEPPIGWGPTIPALGASGPSTPEIELTFEVDGPTPGP